MKICTVAPLAGAWIEIDNWRANGFEILVAPLAGAWIEIPPPEPINKLVSVAPLAGAWIEIALFIIKQIAIESLPSRERGLKFATRHW